MTGEAYRGRKKGLYFRRYLLGLHTNCLGYVLGFLIFRLIVAFVLVVIWVVLDFRPMVLAFPPILKFLLIVALITIPIMIFRLVIVKRSRGGATWLKETIMSFPQTAHYVEVTLVFCWADSGWARTL